MEYLAHSASFQLVVNNAPSKSGIKHLDGHPQAGDVLAQGKHILAEASLIVSARVELTGITAIRFSNEGRETYDAFKQEIGHEYGIGLVAAIIRSGVADNQQSGRISG